MYITDEYKRYHGAESLIHVFERESGSGGERRRANSLFIDALLRLFGLDGQGKV